MKKKRNNEITTTTNNETKKLNKSARFNVFQIILPTSPKKNSIVKYLDLKKLKKKT